MLQVKLLDKEAKPPARATKASAGYDIFALECGSILPRSKHTIRTGIAIRLQEGTYARIASKSGLSAKKSIEVGAGVIDADYRGEILVILYNHSDKPFSYNKQDKVAQLIVEKYYSPEVEIIEDFGEEDLDRFGGFGSTGV
jgi:dUTP pyrophosphatase